MLPRRIISVAFWSVSMGAMAAVVAGAGNPKKQLHMDGPCVNVD